ncbi:hypothetical protein [Micromonospora sp. CPCC 205561]|uniref:hypothetical protein n=1 Tax=Micromonospora sp. CPCC 205561 TaxID=3122407 RepID=UPI002FF086BE
MTVIPEVQQAPADVVGRREAPRAEAYRARGAGTRPVLAPGRPALRAPDPDEAPGAAPDAPVGRP